MPKDYPAIRSECVQGAKLYANRYDMIKGLPIPQGALLAEVGVAHGNFTEFLLRQLNPRRFYALDIFEMEKLPVHWGVPQEVVFKGKTHYDFYRDRFAALGERVIAIRGPSIETMSTLPEASFDMIYVDANHEYEHVSREAAIAIRKIKHDGVVIFNDYVLYDPFMQVEYGVVQAVNEILDSGAWQVVGFALERHMFCDIAIKRVQSGAT